MARDSARRVQLALGVSFSIIIASGPGAEPDVGSVQGRSHRRCGCGPAAWGGTNARVFIGQLCGPIQTLEPDALMVAIGSIPDP